MLLLSPPSKRQHPGDGLFLPDFCSIQMLLVVVVIAQLLAFVLMLAGSSPGQRWQDLGLISLFVQWVALCSVLGLCLLRPLLRRLDNTRAAFASYALLLSICLLISELAYQFVGSIVVTTVRPGWQHADFLLRNLAISAIISAISLRYFYIQYCSQQALLAENNSRIEALQARIRPHFLFNSMNVIASLTRRNAALAESAIEDLAQVFRASLASARQQVALRDELEICRSYLHIEQLRLGERLQCRWEVDKGLEDMPLPSLLIQPLVENAVIHGIEPLAEGGEIVIRIHKSGQHWLIEVDNPCRDCEGDTRGNQIAQANIHERLAAIYAGQASMQIRRHNGRYVVQVTLPLEVEA
ncbi:sensor histidine kinase [Sulfuriflexus mobilis]|uniref:sensor histidine kinase n=1 Tax=Sulfuriflexus mobilis TaxID=1811807 RepID=UPI000F8306AB|nr:histidine kinase [Sulfuriflexus mobilis]